MDEMDERDTVVRAKDYAERILKLVSQMENLPYVNATIAAAHGSLVQAALDMLDALRYHEKSKNKY